MVPLMLRLPDDLHKGIKESAARNKRSLNREIEYGLYQYLQPAAAAVLQEVECQEQVIHALKSDRKTKGVGTVPKAPIEITKGGERHDNRRKKRSVDVDAGDHRA